MQIRSWNLFHGNADPPTRRGYLRAMVELITADRPAVVCLQEIPLWALGRLDEWSGMQCFPGVARRPRLPGSGGRALTSVHLGLFRSALVGQANAILVATELAAADLGSLQVSEEGRERRIVQAVRVDGLGVVANLHLTNQLARPEVPLAELGRARAFVEALAEPDEAVVIAGDLNVGAPMLEGYSGPGPGIDHVLVRGRPAGPIVVWAKEQTTHGRVVLSDHPPVELTLC